LKALYLESENHYHNTEKYYHIRRKIDPDSDNYHQMAENHSQLNYLPEFRH